MKMNIKMQLICLLFLITSFGCWAMEQESIEEKKRIAINFKEALHKGDKAKITEIFSLNPEVCVNLIKEVKERKKKVSIEEMTAPSYQHVPEICNTENSLCLNADSFKWLFLLSNNKEIQNLLLQKLHLIGQKKVTTIKKHINLLATKNLENKSIDYLLFTLLVYKKLYDLFEALRYEQILDKMGPRDGNRPNVCMWYQDSKNIVQYLKENLKKILLDLYPEKTSIDLPEDFYSNRLHRIFANNLMASFKVESSIYLKILNNMDKGYLKNLCIVRQATAQENIKTTHAKKLDLISKYPISNSLPVKQHFIPKPRNFEPINQFNFQNMAQMHLLDLCPRI